MDFITWKDEYSVGYEVIDNQHKKLIILINDLYSAFMNKSEPVSTDRLIRELTEYAEKHFQEEERLFKQHNYIETEAHIKEHNLFISKTTELFEQFKNNPKMLSIRMTGFLQKWLINHILESDMKYRGQLGSK